MAIHLQRVGEVADGSVTATKLADGAVDLSTTKVTGELPTDKLADSAVTEGKLAALAVTTAKLQNAAITLSKADRALLVHHFITDDTEVIATGLVEQVVKILSFVKAANANLGLSPNRLAVQVELKTSNAAKQATLKLYVDAEASPRFTLNSTSESYELLADSQDISDLTNGKHTLTLKLLNAAADGISYNQLFAMFLEK